MFFTLLAFLALLLSEAMHECVDNTESVSCVVTQRPLEIRYGLEENTIAAYICLYVLETQVFIGFFFIGTDNIYKIFHSFK